MQLQEVVGREALQPLFVIFDGGNAEKKEENFKLTRLIVSLFTNHTLTRR